MKKALALVAAIGALGLAAWGFGATDDFADTVSDLKTAPVEQHE